MAPVAAHAPSVPKVPSAPTALNAPRAPCELMLPGRLAGRLIGRGGATIQELERETGCRVRASKCEGQTLEGSEPLMSVAIRCVAACAAADLEVKTMRCLRAAQLLCLDGLSVSEALEQADQERKIQEHIETERWEQEQRSAAVRRILIGNREFDEENVRAALCEACDDEDLALDMLYGGFQATCNRPQHHVEVVPAAEKAQVVTDEFPALLKGTVTLATNPAVACCTAWSRRSVSRRQATYAEEFPCLPTPVPKPSVHRSLRALKPRLRQRA